MWEEIHLRPLFAILNNWKDQTAIWAKWIVSTSTELRLRGSGWKSQPPFEQVLQGAITFQAALLGRFQQIWVWHGLAKGNNKAFFPHPCFPMATRRLQLWMKGLWASSSVVAACSQQVVGAGDFPPWIFLWSCFRTRSSNKADVGLYFPLPPCNMVALCFQFFQLEMKYKMVNRSFFEFLSFTEITQVWLPFNLKEEPKEYYSKVQSQVCMWSVLSIVGIVLQIDSKSLQSYIPMSNLLL